MINKLIKHFIFALIFAYFFGAFKLWELNPGLWGIEVRYSTFIVFVVTLLVTIAFHIIFVGAGDGSNNSEYK